MLVFLVAILLVVWATNDFLPWRHKNNNQNGFQQESNSLAQLNKAMPPNLKNYMQGTWQMSIITKGEYSQKGILNIRRIWFKKVSGQGPIEIGDQIKTQIVTTYHQGFSEDWDAIKYNKEGEYKFTFTERGLDNLEKISDDPTSPLHFYLKPVAASE